VLLWQLSGEKPGEANTLKGEREGRVEISDRILNKYDSQTETKLRLNI